MTQFIRNFFWRSGWSVGTKLPVCWQLKDKKNSPSTINNHSFLFDVQSAYRREREREKEKEREKKSVMVYQQTQNTPDRTHWMPIYNSPNWQCHLAKLLHHLTRVPKFLQCFYFLNQTCNKIWIYFILFTNPSTRAGYNTRSIFKRILTGLNSEFSFS